MKKLEFFDLNQSILTCTACNVTQKYFKTGSNTLSGKKIKSLQLNCGLQIAPESRYLSKLATVNLSLSSPNLPRGSPGFVKKRSQDHQDRQAHPPLMPFLHWPHVLFSCSLSGQDPASKILVEKKQSNDAKVMVPTPQCCRCCKK